MEGTKRNEQRRNETQRTFIARKLEQMRLTDELVSKIKKETESEVTMQKNMQTCKTQKQRRRILRSKNVDQTNRRMETEGN